ncbi:MAG TPA: hypothetical protein VMU38_04120 [Candidatus Binatia bacterium]|nr:hypothetical protein [Candidatus Binatia bacterium]
MESPDSTPQPDRRILFWIGFGVGIAVLGAALGYMSLRLVNAGRREDPTSQRIQQLIDEANSLLKALDEQRESA